MGSGFKNVPGCRVHVSVVSCVDSCTHTYTRTHAAGGVFVPGGQPPVAQCVPREAGKQREEKIGWPCIEPTNAHTPNTRNYTRARKNAKKRKNAGVDAEPHPGAVRLDEDARVWAGYQPVVRELNDRRRSFVDRGSGVWGGAVVSHLFCLV